MNKIEKFINEKFEEDINLERYFVFVVYSDGDRQSRNIGELTEIAGTIYPEEPISYIEIIDLKNKTSWWTDDVYDLNKFLNLLNEIYEEQYR